MTVFPLPKETSDVSSLPTERLARMNTTGMMKDTELVDNIRNIINIDTIDRQNQNNKHLKTISWKPIVSRMPVKNVMPNYQIDDSELLNVCENKVFVLKNYCNYLHDE